MMQPKYGINDVGEHYSQFLWCLFKYFRHYEIYIECFFYSEFVYHSEDFFWSCWSNRFSHSDVQLPVNIDVDIVRCERGCLIQCKRIRFILIAECQETIFFRWSACWRFIPRARYFLEWAVCHQGCIQRRDEIIKGLYFDLSNEFL